MLAWAIAGPSAAGWRAVSAIEVVLQDRVDGGVGARADLERPAAGGLEPLAAVGLGEPQDAEAGAEALLGVGRSRRMVSTSAAVLGPISAASRAQALRRPVGIAPVARRHVLAHRGVAAFGDGAQVRGDALAAMEDLDRAWR